MKLQSLKKENVSNIVMILLLTQLDYLFPLTKGVIGFLSCSLNLRA